MKEVEKKEAPAVSGGLTQTGIVYNPPFNPDYPKQPGGPVTDGPTNPIKDHL